MNKEELWCQSNTEVKTEYEYDRRVALSRENIARFMQLFNLVRKTESSTDWVKLRLDISENREEELWADMVVDGPQGYAIKYNKASVKEGQATLRVTSLSLEDWIGEHGSIVTGAVYDHAESLDMLEQAAADPELNPELAKRLAEAEEKEV